MIQATGKEKGDQTLARPMTASVLTIRPFPPPTSLRLVSGSPTSQKGGHLHKTSVSVLL
jgi:hypothetical protein